MNTNFVEERRTQHNKALLELTALLGSFACSSLLWMGFFMKPHWLLFLLGVVTLVVAVISGFRVNRMMSTWAHYKARENTER